MNVRPTGHAAVPVLDAHVSASEFASCGVGCLPRLRVEGKFLFAGEQKFWIRGVTYGTFKPDPEGGQFPSREKVEQDFRAMARAGLNSVRVYTPPPLWMMDLAAECGLRVMAGLPWEQHIAFLDDKDRARRILETVRADARRLAGHPALLCHAVGNEIPASVVRWHGKTRIEKFIRDLCSVAKAEDPGSLVTYVNFPTTEYLDLPFLDFVAFNVYLENRDRLAAYLARLQNRAGERPLVMAEIGLDSRRNGEDRQAESLRWQIDAAFEAGCAGAFVFAWTDEWFRGGQDVSDWDFGLVTRERRPKLALQAVSSAFEKVPFGADRIWPKVSVVVCSHNGARTIEQTLSALKRLDYPSYEIIVVDDGSTDRTAAIAAAYADNLFRTENRGLSAARNHGLRAATGEIVAYLDDDAYPDPHWVTYLASAFLRTEHAGIGGPNLAPPGDGLIADCVANAPGGPVHVLLSDEIAEHIPGCNMAFRRDKLASIGGFDTRFWVAGDDVDICWRIQEMGWTIGFSPAAVVWHHRRNSAWAYFKQQRGYARAEALLAVKWPAKYNSVGHLTWRGRLYGRGVVEILFQPGRIYHGIWGSAPFQLVYEPAPGYWPFLMLMPEWYFLLLSLAVLTALGASWSPLLWSSPLLLAGASLTLIQAMRGGRRARFHPEPRSKLRLIGLQALVAGFHLVQPAARLLGRIQHGLGPWGWKGPTSVIPLHRVQSLWSERWEAIETRLTRLKQIVEQSGTVPVTGGDFDRWDLSIRGGLFGLIRVVVMVEEHGNGRQLFRFRSWPKAPAPAVAILLALATLAVLAALDHAWVAGAFLGAAAGALGFLIYGDCAIAVSQWREAVAEYVRGDPDLSILPRLDPARDWDTPSAE
jgi:O-antigen biosynthesis protein